MKKFLFFFIISSYFSFAQNAPSMQWQKVVMTGLNDRINDIVQTADGGYISIGQTNTYPGSSFDCAISKIDVNGNPVWSKTVGGTGNDFGKKIIKLADGNFIIVGATSSTDGDMTGHYSTEKMWAFKMDNTGNFIWKKFYTGEGINDILPISDGFILVGGVTVSGFTDIRINKISLDGNLIWTKTYGGSADDAGVKIDLTPENNFIIFAQTRSNNGNISNNHGQQDAWVLTIDNAGNLLSQKTYGGSAWDYATDFFKDVDGYVFWGQTASMDGDLTGVAVDDDSDYWIFKTDFSGNILWQKKIGSTFAEYYNWGKIIKSTDNNYIAMGLVWNGYKTVAGSGYHGASDIWLLKFDTLGNILWKKCWGGSTYDYALNFIQNNDGSIVIAGGTNSQDGDLLGSGKNTGNEDTWIFKLAPEFLSVNEKNDQIIASVFPNPTADFVNIETNNKIQNIEVYNSSGQLLMNSTKTKVDLTSFINGVYFIKVKTSEGEKIHKVIKK